MSRFEWTQSSTKIRHGIYGPQYIALNQDSSEVMTVEKLDKISPRITKTILHNLRRKQYTIFTPNVVTYLGYQKRSQEIYVFREYIAGPNIREYIDQRGPIPEHYTQQFLYDTALALSQLQVQGTPVSFISTNKIFLQYDESVKVEPSLLDLDMIGDSFELSQADLAKHGEFALTPMILTIPELDLGCPMTEKADTWCLGIAAVEMLTGRSDWNSISVVTIKERIAQDCCLYPLSIIPKEIAGCIGDTALDFLQRCFTVDPEARPSIGELLNHPFLYSARYSHKNGSQPSSRRSSGESWL